jgi:regulator of protease activity HflC (stomatin/prohibitin superfamily)
MTNEELDALCERLASRDSISELNPGPAIVLCGDALAAIKALREDAEAEANAAMMHCQARRKAERERDEARKALEEVIDDAVAAWRSLSNSPAIARANALLASLKEPT